METKVKFFPILFLLFIIGVVAYMESEIFFEKQNKISMIPVNSNESEVPTSGNATEDITVEVVFEYMLVDSEVIDGYILETYREFEIHKDRGGNVIKSVPTSNFDYLRYKK